MVLFPSIGESWRKELGKEKKRAKEQIESTKNTILKQVRRVDVQVERLKADVLGHELESEVLGRFKVLFADNLGRHARIMDAKELDTMAETIQYVKMISREEKVAALSVDFVIMAGVFDDGRGQQYLIEEISQKIEMTDVNRASTRARIWATILGVEECQCLPYVVGRKGSQKVLEQAQKLGVSVVRVEDKIPLDEEARG